MSTSHQLHPHHAALARRPAASPAAAPPAPQFCGGPSPPPRLPRRGLARAATTPPSRRCSRPASGTRCARRGCPGRTRWRSASSTIERLTQRRVKAFMSANHQSPDVTVECSCSSASRHAEQDAPSRARLEDWSTRSAMTKVPVQRLPSREGRRGGGPGVDRLGLARSPIQLPFATLRGICPQDERPGARSKRAPLDQHHDEPTTAPERSAQQHPRGRLARDGAPLQGAVRPRADQGAHRLGRPRHARSRCSRTR